MLQLSVFRLKIGDVCSDREISHDFQQQLATIFSNN